MNNVAPPFKETNDNPMNEEVSPNHNQDLNESPNAANNEEEQLQTLCN